jgi:5-aminolevulinate synthase
MAAVKYLKDHPELRDQHQTQATKLKQGFLKAGIEVLDLSTTHIVPVMIRDAHRCKAMSDHLLNEHGIFVQPINYPTVAVGEERLRFAPTPLHTDAMIDECVRAVKETINEFT